MWTQDCGSQICKLKIVKGRFSIFVQNAFVYARVQLEISDSKYFFYSVVDFGNRGFCRFWWGNITFKDYEFEVAIQNIKKIYNFWATHFQENVMGNFLLMVGYIF